MREIKFRGWDLNKHKMNYEPYVVGDETICEWDMVHLNKGIKEYEHPLMQYTGLKDKNGKEIYEGDIVSSLYAFEGCKGVYEIIWREDAKFHPVRHGIHQQERVTITMNDIKRCEVLGNIYENPELLDTPTKQ